MILILFLLKMLAFDSSEIFALILIFFWKVALK